MVGDIRSLMSRERLGQYLMIFIIILTDGILESLAAPAHFVGHAFYPCLTYRASDDGSRLDPDLPQR
jgi:hypothetical protein